MILSLNVLLNIKYATPEVFFAACHLGWYEKKTGISTHYSEINT